MFQSFYNGLSGMFNFSKNLDNISSNISNMNTPGYRGKDLFVRSLEGESNSSLATTLNGTQIRTHAGEIRSTGNNTDVAINGLGHFVLRDDQGGFYYTRAGQFSFDKDGVLIDSATKYKVISIDENLVLKNFDISSLKTLAPKPTTEVKLNGRLAVSGVEHTVSGLSVFDSAGVAHVISLKLTNSGSGTWHAVATDAAQVVVGEFDVKFAADGTPVKDFNKPSVELKFSVPIKVAFNFGEPGSFSGVTQAEISESSVTGLVSDGRASSGVSNISFLDTGVIELEYLNGEKVKGPGLALVSFKDESILKSLSGSLLVSPNPDNAVFGKPKSAALGSIVKNSLELSNVDLTQEFADILIVQRGYQASSKVMSVSNELVEQLYNNSRG